MRPASTANSVLLAEREAEAAVSEFLEMRAAILGKLSVEALRCVPAVLEQRIEERAHERKKNTRF